MTPVLAAAFPAISKSYGISIPQVALTTGFYMLGLGIGSVVASPTAILLGKRPVSFMGIIFFIVSAIWCAVLSSYLLLVIARTVMGLAVSPVEYPPSATITEIFFLHERAFRNGIYTLLLLGGKNLVPLVSAAVVQGLSWQWVFW
jgi:MFS family permease